jgi:hypothetical protein
MGTQVATTYNQSKQDMALSVVAAGALTPGAGELLLWVGDDVSALNQTEVLALLDGCFDALQEAQMPANAATSSGSGTVRFGKANVVFAEGAATPILLETDACVAYNQAYPNLPHNSQLVKGMYNKAREKLFEEHFKLQ